MEEITSRDNPRIRRVCRLMDSKRTREKEGLFCCEGEKLLGEALAAGVEVVQVFLSRDLPLEQQRDRGVPTFLVPSSLMAQMSGVESPQGVLFVCRIPPPRKDLPEGACLVLEDVRDPGNVGTILRTAEAFSLPVVLTGNCAELYNPKVVRSTMGSVFRCQVFRLSRPELWQALEERNIPLYAAALSKSARDIRQVDLKGAAVAIGNEAHGVSAELLEHSRGQVIIPIKGAESLNAGVAAALCMWEMRR